MAIKLIVLDLDGTTLNKEGRLTQRTKDTLELVIKQGVEVVIATGRCFDALPKEVKDIKGLRYTINSNGAQIYDLKKEELIYVNCIAKESVPIIKEVLSATDFLVEVFIQGKAYIEKGNYELVKAGKVSHRHREYVLSTRNPVDNLMAFMLEHEEEVENVNIFFTCDEDKQKMLGRLEEIPHATITSSLASNWEIGGETTSKGEALGFINEKLGISFDQVMACGDSPNDLSMLTKAGLAVAVENGRDEVKAQVDYISRSNGEDGVALAVEKYVLK